MEPRFRPLLAGFVALLATCLIAAPAQADFTESYCSSQNTASTDAFDWQYQSNSKCTEHCNGLGTYAFAVIQYRNCWCSNYIPQQQQNIARCAVGCPGYPSEHCASDDDNTFIYVKLSGRPSGTAGSSPSSQPSPAPVSSAAPPSSAQAASSSSAQIPAPAPPKVVTSFAPPKTTTVIRTTVVSPPLVVIEPSSSTVTSAVTLATPSARSSSTLHTVPSQTPVESPISIQIVTESGAVVTRTVILTPSVNPSANPSASTAPLRTGSDNDRPNIGAIVGGAVGGVIGLLAIIGGVIFFLWRRRRQQREAHDDSSAGMSSGSTGITRNTSTMSKAGLIHGATGYGTQYPPRIATNFGTQISRYGDPESISTSPISNRRNSQPLVVDSRLNPSAVLTFANANAHASRESLVSLDDSRDYGRQLNVRNPDP